MTSERHDKKIQERHKMTMKDRKLPHRDITCLQKGAKQLKKRHKMTLQQKKHSQLTEMQNDDKEAQND